MADLWETFGRIGHILEFHNEASCLLFGRSDGGNEGLRVLDCAEDRWCQTIGVDKGPGGRVHQEVKMF